MRALALVTGRELRAYAPAWIAALVASLLPWLAPLLPTVSYQPAGEVRLGTALVLAVLLGLTFAVFAGAGLLARDLADNRMGFFLALPLPAWSVWGGRLLAAAILVYVTIAAIALPSALAAGELTLRRHAVSGVPELPLLGAPLAVSAAALALAPLFLILLAHQVATALRSRSPWLLVDLAGMAIAGTLVALALTRLAAAAAPFELLLGSGVVAVLALISLVLGGGFGLGRGGVLLARVHRAQASAVAAGLLVSALVLAGFARWVLAVDSADVTTVAAVQAAPHDSWLAVLATLRHRPTYRPWMLVDAATGTSLALSPGIAGPSGQPFEMPAPVAFAADGRQAVWLRPRGHAFDGPQEVVWLDLETPPRLTPSGIDVASAWNTTLLVAGNRLAIAEPRRLSVWSERGRRLLAAAELPRADAAWQELRLLSAERVRLARLVLAGEEGMRLQVWDLELATRRLDARLDQVVSGPEVLSTAALSADGTRLLFVRGWAGRGGVTLLDAGTGEALAQLAPPQKEVWRSAGFLPGGRLAVATGSAGRLSVRLYDRLGTLDRELPLGDGRWAWLGVPWAADLLPFTASVRTAGGPAPAWHGELRAVDLSSGRVRVLGGRLSPVVGAAPWWPGDDRLPPGAPAAWLFRTHDGALARLDAAGRQHPVLPRRP